MKRGRKPRDSRPGQQSRTRSRTRGEIAAPGDADTSAGRGAPETEHPAPSAPKRTAQAPKASHAWQAEMQTRMERNENTLLEVRNLLAQLVPVASQGQPPQNEGSSTPHVPGPPMQPGPSLPLHAEASTSRQCELGYGSSAAQALPASSAPSSAPWPSPASLTNCAGRQFQGRGALGRSDTDATASATLSVDLGATVASLVQASMTAPSRLQYNRTWTKFGAFCKLIGAAAGVPTPIPVMLLFIAHLFNGGYAAASIVSAISVLSYFNKINGFSDPARNFVVAKAIAGVRNARSVADIRLPITESILDRLVQATHVVFNSSYKHIMLKAMMTLAFTAYLRIGEMVPRGPSNLLGCLLRDDVVVDGDIIRVIFRQFKNSRKQGPQSLNVLGGHIAGTELYPATFMKQFIQIRSAGSPILFTLPDGTSMTRRHFDESLKQLLNFCRLDTQHFKGHSFRIGAASAAALRGESDARIRSAGRWSSDAFKKYIRLA